LLAKPIVRISKGRFSPEKYGPVKALIEQSAGPLVPAIRFLPGLLYYHASVDRESDTVVNVSIWEDLEAGKQMDNLQAMLARRPILRARASRLTRLRIMSHCGKSNLLGAADCLERGQ